MKHNRKWLVGIAALVLSLPAQAQQSAPTRQDLENAVKILQQQVEAQQDRVNMVTEKLKATDEQIERRIERVLNYVITVADSKESGTKVQRAKEDAFDALKRNLDFYGRERDTRFAALYRPAQISREDLADDVMRLNNRIEKRVDQALALVASLPAEKQLERYQYDTNNYWGTSSQRTNPEYSHQSRVQGRGNVLRDKAYAGLKASIDKLQRSRLELDRAMQYAKTDEGRKFVQGLIQRNEELVAKRREQIQTALSQSNPSANALGSKAADALLLQIQEEKMNNMKDNAEWIRLKNDRDVERARLRSIEGRLASYQRQLQTAKF